MAGWVERSEPHHFSGEFFWWGSLARPTLPFGYILPQTRTFWMSWYACTILFRICIII